MHQYLNQLAKTWVSFQKFHIENCFFCLFCSVCLGFWVFIRKSVVDLKWTLAVLSTESQGGVLGTEAGLLRQRRQCCCLDKSYPRLCYKSWPSCAFQSQLQVLGLMIFLGFSWGHTRNKAEATMKEGLWQQDGSREKSFSKWGKEEELVFSYLSPSPVFGCHRPIVTLCWSDFHISMALALASSFWTANLPKLRWGGSMAMPLPKCKVPTARTTLILQKGEQKVCQAEGAEVLSSSSNCSLRLFLPY